MFLAFARQTVRALPLPVALAVVPCCSSSSGGTGGSVGGSDAAAGTQSLWVVPASLDALSGTSFYDHPWPSDLRRDDNGYIVTAGFYNPFNTSLLANYIQASAGLLKGFSPSASAYLRFSGDIDPTSLPADPPSSATATSGIQLVDVDPSSPEHGQRKLVETFWQQPDGVYWIKDTLAVQPALGYPLRPSTRYALVVTSAVRAADGSAIRPSADLSEVLGLAPTEPRVQPAHDLYAPAVADLAALGLPASSIVHLAVFTTNDPTADVFAVADDVHRSVPPPAVDPATWVAKDQPTDYDVYEGTYGPSPNYQAGTPPYNTSGGNFVFDASGKPILQNTFTQQFCLVVPKAQACPAPAAGYPIMLYAHGTGGDYRSVVDEHNSFGDLLAQHCVASIGINQIFSGTRPGSPGTSDPNYESDEDLLFFNLGNPLAARTNGQQGAIDFVQLARLFTESKVTVPAAVSRTTAAIAFDATKVIFVGHSEGGLDGPIFLAADSQALGGVLSGSGAMITVALLEKTQPQPSVAQAVKAILNLDKPEDAAELNLFHPVLNLAQSIVDATDPVNYARYVIQTPRAGFAPKSILQTEGVNPDGTGDSYAPPHGIEIHSVALGLPRQSPGVHTIKEAAWGGPGDATVPSAGLQGNLAAGKASGVLGQFVPAPNDDGHFVAFDVPAAHSEVGAFCQSLAASPPGVVPPVSP
jgi:hypothetical protein